ncbi:hypothetical protein [Streptomyces sp. NPDC056194]|uniref:hypothetical protein n=1 Tax=unclassified Streptomyces TaxID=2593676 RepID=UPI0035DEE030
MNSQGTTGVVAKTPRWNMLTLDITDFDVSARMLAQPDWSVGNRKGNCPNPQRVVGIARTASRGLCTDADQPPTISGAFAKVTDCTGDRTGASSAARMTTRLPGTCGCLAEPRADSHPMRHHDGMTRRKLTLLAGLLLLCIGTFCVWVGLDRADKIANIVGAAATAGGVTLAIWQTRSAAGAVVDSDSDGDSSGTAAEGSVVQTGVGGQDQTGGPRYDLAGPAVVFHSAPPASGGIGVGDAAAVLAVVGAVAVALVAVNALNRNPDRSLESLPPAQSVHASSGSSPTMNSSPAGEMTVTCKVLDDLQNVQRGRRIELTYEIYTPTPVHAGLGAGLYDNAGNDHANSTGDRDDVSLTAGRQNVIRQIEIPRHLTGGRYEIAAEVWPANQVGSGETLADDSCTTVTLR